MRECACKFVSLLPRWLRWMNHYLDAPIGGLGALPLPAALPSQAMEFLLVAACLLGLYIFEVEGVDELVEVNDVVEEELAVHVWVPSRVAIRLLPTGCVSCEPNISRARSRCPWPAWGIN